MDGSLLPAGGNSSSVAGTLTVCGADTTRKTNLYFSQAAINGLSGEGIIIAWIVLSIALQYLLYAPL